MRPLHPPGAAPCSERRPVPPAPPRHVQRPPRTNLASAASGARGAPMSGAVPRITGRAPAPPTGAAALARTVRLLTAVALLGMALLAVALVGHSVAGAREQPPAAGPGPVESATARYTAPAAGPLTRSPAYAQAGRLLEAIPGRPPRTARAGAAGASWP